MPNSPLSRPRNRKRNHIREIDLGAEDPAAIAEKKRQRTDGEVEKAAIDDTSELGCSLNSEDGKPPDPGVYQSDSLVCATMGTTTPRDATPEIEAEAQEADDSSSGIWARCTTGDSMSEVALPQLGPTWDSLVSPHSRRRVSFADEEDSADEFKSGGDYRPLSLISAIEDDGEHRYRVGSQVQGNDSHRSIRRRQTTEFIRAARVLLFAGTRPDGLRPVTGAPVVDGVGVRAPGGIFVGLAGLRGYDLSWTTKQWSSLDGSAQPSLSPHSSASTQIAAGADECFPSPAKSALEEVSLLSRAPGSLAEEESIDASIGHSTGSLQGSIPLSGQGEVHIASKKRPCKTATEHPADANSPHDAVANGSSIREKGTPDEETEQRAYDSVVIPTTQSALQQRGAPGITLEDYTQKPAILWSASSIGVDEMAACARTDSGCQVTVNLRILHLNGVFFRHRHHVVWLEP